LSPHSSPTRRSSDLSLDPEENPTREGRYRFTLAHEGGGHWRLHQHLIVQNTAQASFLDAASEPRFICRTSEAKERVEWQADFYRSEEHTSELQSREN